MDSIERAAVMSEVSAGQPRARGRFGRKEPLPKPQRAEFEFDLKVKHFITDQKILEGLRRLGETLGGRAPTSTQFAEWAERPCSVVTVCKRFGSWMLGLGAAGFETRGMTKAELMETLERVWREMERVPGHRSLRERAGVSQTPYRRHWGSVRKACEQLAKFHKGEISRAELVGVEIGKPLTGRALLRWKVLERDGHKCQACGRTPAEHGVALEVDHIVARANGGGNEMENLRALCGDCNRGKGAR